MTSKWVMAISLVIAALILPQALAASVGFSVPAGSMSSTFSSTPGGYVQSTSFGNTNVLGGSGLITAPLGGSVSQYYEWISTNGLAKAAAFAYMQDSSSYQYQFTGSRGSTWARANLKFSATDAEDYLLGGFAFNPTNYAGALLSGDGADSIKYSNSLYASSSGVSATQSFSGTDFEGLYAATWAERGYLGDEITKEGDIDPVVTGTWDPQPGWHSADDALTNAIASEQDMYLDEGSILNPFKPYKATASLYMNAATSSQSVALNGADDDDAHVILFGIALIGWVPSLDIDDNTGLAAEVVMYADGVTGKLNNVVYSSSAKATTSLASASQSASVYQADWIDKGALSYNFDKDLYSIEETDVDRYADNSGFDSGISSSMTGTDSAIVGAGSSSVTQYTKASGAYINKYTYAGPDFRFFVLGDIEDIAYGVDGPGYYAIDSTSIFGDVKVDFTDADGNERTDTLARVPEKASTLSGKSIATATKNGAAITGSWKASIARDLTDYEGILDRYETEYGDDFKAGENFGYSFVSVGLAYNGDESIKRVQKSTHYAAIPSYVFRELDRANAFGTWT